jgi:hypothetical protein
MKRIAVLATLALFAGLRVRATEPALATARANGAICRNPGAAETSAKASKVFTGTITQDKDGSEAI